jgi:hypothetical protein
MGDQPVARPLPTHDNTKHGKEADIHQRLEKEKTFRALDWTTTVIVVGINQFHKILIKQLRVTINLSLRLIN